VGPCRTEKGGAKVDRTVPEVRSTRGGGVQILFTGQQDGGGKNKGQVGRHIC